MERFIEVKYRPAKDKPEIISQFLMHEPLKSLDRGDQVYNRVMDWDVDRAHRGWEVNLLVPSNRLLEVQANCRHLGAGALKQSGTRWEDAERAAEEAYRELAPAPV